MSKYCLVIIILLTSFACAIVENDNHERFFNPPEVKSGSILNVEDCVSLAFKNSPKIRRKKYELDIAKNNIRLAQSNYFPILSAGVGFNYERNSNSVYYDKKYRDLPNVGVAINKMIWDFGKTTSLIKMEKFYKIIAEYEFTDILCHTLFDIKAKYYALLKMSSLEEIAKENVELNKQFKEIAKKGIDTETADVYLVASSAKYINAQGDTGTAKINLNNSMYLDKDIDYKIKNTETYTGYEIKSKFNPIVFPFDTKDAVNIAYKNSPDLAVLTNTKSALEESLKYVKKQYLPELSGGVGYGLNNTNFATNNSLQVGVNLTSQTNLMEHEYKIKNAKSEINIADTEIDLFKQDLKFEVQRAIGNVEYYKKQLLKLKIEVKEAKEVLDKAFVQYKANNLDFTALHDSIEDYIYACEKYVNCLYDYNMSLIQTEMAMHYHIVDIHHKAEHAMHHHADELIEHLNDVLDCNKKENGKKK